MSSSTIRPKNSRSKSLSNPNTSAFEARKGAAELAAQIQKWGSKRSSRKPTYAAMKPFPLLFDEPKSAFGRVDILVNNAATCEMPTTYFSNGLEHRASFRREHKGDRPVNSEFVTGTRRGAEHWEESSTSARTPLRLCTQISYGASKAAIEAYTTEHFLGSRHLGITVNTVAPAVQTGWMSAELVEYVLPGHSLGRVGTPEDIADSSFFWLPIRRDG